jgi:hypothetical protein
MLNLGPKEFIMWIVVAAFFSLMGCEQEKPLRVKMAMEISRVMAIWHIRGTVRTRFTDTIKQNPLPQRHKENYKQCYMY